MDRRNFIAGAATAAVAAAGIRGVVEIVEPKDRTIVFLTPDKPMPQQAIDALRDQWKSVVAERPWMPCMIVLPHGFTMTVVNAKSATERRA